MKKQYVEPAIKVSVVDEVLLSNTSGEMTVDTSTTITTQGSKSSSFDVFDDEEE